MTLILVLSKDEGVYLSTDFRVRRGAKLVNDESIKLLRVDFPPLGTGARSILAYAGAAEVLPTREPMGDWIRKTLRGEAEPPTVAFRHLQERLNRDVAPMGVGLIIAGVVVEGWAGETRHLVQLTNLRADSSGVHVDPDFAIGAMKLDKTTWMATGSGMQSLSAANKATLQRNLSVRPRRALGHMLLLSEINRTVAKVDQTVSPACQVAFIRAAPMQPGETDHDFGPTLRVFARSGDGRPAETFPYILAGFDLSEGFAEFRANLAALEAGQPFMTDTAEMNRRIARKP